jgi:F-type H+-transporting ATPase subunit b
MEYIAPFTQMAETASSGEKGIFASLGIDWTLLVLQLIAFLILVVLLRKFVYPVFIRVIDERQEKIDESVKAAQAAEQKAESAQEDIAALLKEARKEAKDIVTTAKDEAAAMVEASDKKAKQRAEKIVADAHEQIEKDVIAARKTLHNDTIDLVALATEKVVGASVTDKIDSKIIANAIKEAQ